MRTLSLAAGIIAVGTLAALPFRRSEPPVDINAPVSIATGPLSRQLQHEAVSDVIPWPNRAGYDASLAWQPQPLTFDTSPHAFEMPPMPDSFPDDTIEVPMPAAIRERFSAAVPQPESSDRTGYLMPPTDTIEDRFIYTPPSEPLSPSRSGSIRAASSIRADVDNDTPTSERHFIREPR